MKFLIAFIVVIFIYFGLELDKPPKCDGHASHEIEKLMLNTLLKYGTVDVEITLHDIKELSYNKQINARKCSAYATSSKDRDTKIPITYTLQRIPITKGGGTEYIMFGF